MKAALAGYLKGMVRHWWALIIGGALGLYGAFKEIGLEIPDAPRWFLWPLSTLSFIVASFLAYRDVWSELRSHDKPLPDMPLREAVAHVTGVDLKLEPGNIALVGNCFHDLQQKAAIGTIAIFGRQECMDGDERGYPLVPILSDCWNKNRLDLMYYLQKPRGRTDPTRDAIWWSDIHLNRAQILREWPPPRRSCAQDLRSILRAWVAKFHR